MFDCCRITRLRKRADETAQYRLSLHRLTASLQLFLSSLSPCSRNFHLFLWVPTVCTGVASDARRFRKNGLSRPRKRKRLRGNPRNSFASTICIRRHSRAAVCTHFQTRDMGVRETDGKVFSFYFTPILRRCFLSFSVITFSGRRKKMGWHFI